MAGSPRKKAKREGKLTLTPEIHAKIVRIVAAGGFKSHAAASCRVDAKTLERCISWGREGREPFAAFVADLDAAQADDAIELEKTIRAHGADDWKAPAWLLERKFPKLYGDRGKANGAATVPIQIVVHPPDSPEVTAAVGRLGGDAPAIEAGED